MSFGGQPPTLHLTLCAATATGTGELVTALGESAAAARAAGPVRVDPQLAAAAQRTDPDALEEATLDGLLTVAGLAGDGATVAVPERMAEVNALLDALPPRLREALLAAVLDRLTR